MKHKECEELDGCILKEHKGYDTCERQGTCNLAAFDEAPSTVCPTHGRLVSLDGKCPAC